MLKPYYCLISSFSTGIEERSMIIYSCCANSVDQHELYIFVLPKLNLKEEKCQQPSIGSNMSIYLKKYVFHFIKSTLIASDRYSRHLK